MKKCDTSINKFYPQKTALSLTLKKDSDTQISWSQDLSMLDLVFWFDQTVSDEQRELETPEDYRAMLEQNGWKGKTITETFLQRTDSYDWDVVTEVQKKSRRKLDNRIRQHRNKRGGSTDRKLQSNG